MTSGWNIRDVIKEKNLGSKEMSPNPQTYKMPLGICTGSQFLNIFIMAAEAFCA